MRSCRVLAEPRRAPSMRQTLGNPCWGDELHRCGHGTSARPVSAVRDRAEGGGGPFSDVGHGLGTGAEGHAGAGSNPRECPGPELAVFSPLRQLRNSALDCEPVEAIVGEPASAAARRWMRGTSPCAMLT